MRSPIVGAGLLLCAATASFLLNHGFQSSSPSKRAALPATKADLERTLAPSAAIIDKTADSCTWQIPFVTSRQPVGTDPEKRLVTGRFSTIQLGTCLVDIPLYRPDGICKVVPENAANEISDTTGCLTRHNTRTLAENEFMSLIGQHVTDSPDRDVLVFVHGFNVTFHEAVCRAAQLANDLPFNGSVICFSWPSQGEMDGYTQDTQISELGPWGLASLLARLRENLASDVRIHVLAHSMGNRVLLGALQALRGHIPSSPSSNLTVVDPTAFCDRYGAWHLADEGQPPLEHVVFAAPDVESQAFKKAVRLVRPLMQSATLYVSSWDVALWASYAANLGEERAGDANQLVLMDELITIDVTPTSHRDALGHSYYGNSRQVLADLFHLLKLGRAPEFSPWLAKRSSWGRPYWALDGEPPQLMSFRAKTVR